MKKTEANKKRNNLVIIDFSGTLSLGAVMFSRAGKLMQALQESGLTELGIKNPDLFWNELIGPTWEEGSTTAQGYVNTLTERLRELTAKQPEPSSISRARSTVSRFADAYLAHSRIDSRWKPALGFLKNRDSTDTVVATDHYAEATAHIVNELAALGFAARSIGQNPREGEIAVANSADLGFHKSKKEFWSVLKSALGDKRYNRVLLIDDFGYNEQEEEVYGDKPKVMARREDSAGMLKAVFQAELYIFSFFLKDPRAQTEDLEKVYGSLIEQAYAFLQKHCV